MAALCKLNGRKILSALSLFERNSLVFIRPVTIKAKPHVKEKIEDFRIYNEKLHRPLSPHLTIYAPQLTSMLSITHRITGVAMSGMVVALGLGSLIPGDYTTFITSLNLSAPVLFGAKLCIAFPFSYHFTNGIRHLSWDTGRFLTIKEVYSTGYAMVGVALFVTFILASL